jgi:hypothetical protein
MDGDEDRLHSVDVSTASAHAGERKGIRRRGPWQHPLYHAIEFPYQVAAAIAVMEMGISEYGVIAEAVGLTVAELKVIGTAADTKIRQIAFTATFFRGSGEREPWRSTTRVAT